MTFYKSYVVFSLLVVASCKQEYSVEKSTKTLFTQIDNKAAGISFINTVTNKDHFNIFNYRNFYNGGGVGIGDINNDGLPEVLLTSNMDENKLFLNLGNFKFKDISIASHIVGSDKRWATGVVFVDINNDGWLDIYICNAGYQKGMSTRNELYINNKDLTFTEQAKDYGLDEDGYTTHAAFFDYDKDGDLDCYILNNSFIPVNTLNNSNKRDLRAKDWDVPDMLKGGGDKLLKNDKGIFKDVSEQAGIYGSLIGFGLGISVSDFNDDGWPDIYVSNDFFEKDYLYINNQNGTFEEDLENRVGHTSLSSMGSDVGDINNDGLVDLFATDMLPDEDKRLKTTTSFENIDVHNLKVQRGFYYQYAQNTLQLNTGNGQFAEISNFANVQGSDWSWGALMFDADCDGLQDIIVSNGIYKDVIDQDFVDFFADEIIQNMVLSGHKEKVNTIADKIPSRPIPNKAFHNLGNNRFQDAANAWGLGTPSFSNGAAYGDLDNDGDLDLIISNVNQEVSVYKNRRDTTNHTVTVQLRGDKKNTYAIGSKVEIFCKNQILVREIMPSRGFQSSVDYKVVIGIGKEAKIDSMHVLWPNGDITSEFSNKTNYIFDFGGAKRTKSKAKPTITQTIFQKVDAIFAAHKEDEFIDFYNERGIIEMLSKEGPAYASGDIDGDGNEDLFIGGAKGGASHFYLNKGNFYTTSPFDLSIEGFEDVAATFFDADNDKDLDLFVGSGGNFKFPLTREMQDRLYINDGKGKFALSIKSFPDNGMNTSSVTVWDFDGDGDNDLFVGSRSYPTDYGKAPDSYLYENDGTGLFKNVAKKMNPLLNNAGYVVGSVAVNVDKDPDLELVVLAQWQYPKVFKYKNGKFDLLPSNLEKYAGLWNFISAADLDGDGDKDLVLGNIGENFYLSHYPLKLWIEDFDKNNTTDKIITRKINGKDKPIMMKKEFMEQMPLFKKNNMKHEEYSTKSIQELLGKRISDNTIKAEAGFFKSIVLENLGNGKFNCIILPDKVQLSSMHCCTFADVNKDNAVDIIMGGNKDNYTPQFGRLDASSGEVIINTANHTWKMMDRKDSGLMLKGNVKHLDILQQGRNNYLLAIINNDKPALYKIN